jgi:uncharacterized protein (DUF2252 family)
MASKSSSVANQAWGKSLRREAPRSSHGEWSPPQDRPDAVDVITSQNASRLPWLVPIRHWRMSESPFTFYRGAAKLMAMDLASTPVSTIEAQICGDAHLSNFGVYGSPERKLVFDVNDFDETLPGPWEWDVKRLAASFAIAARHKGMGELEYSLAVESARAYRDAVTSFAATGYLDAWYAHLRVKDINKAFADELTKKQRKKSRKFAKKARSKDSTHALKKLTTEVDGSYRIVAQPPLIVPFRDIPEPGEEEAFRAATEATLIQYVESVPNELQVLLRRYTAVDGAIKVVGVGSVGTRCFIVLLQGRDAEDPLFLQIKEANRSVLEEHLPPSKYENHGQRVVEGQKLMQAASDGFLGWTIGDADGVHYYVRQFKDMKASPDIEAATEDAMHRFATLCGWTLARAHARSGHAAATAGYLGSGTVFDEAIGDFAVAYADQNERDYTEFMVAIEEGRIQAHE